MRKHVDYIGVRDAAKIVDRTQLTVLRWIKIGKLPIVGRLPGPNGAYLLDRAEVEKLAAELAAEASA